MLLNASIACGEDLGDLRSWLERENRPALDDQGWARRPLSRSEAAQANKMLWEDHVARIRRERADEWKAKRIQIDDKEMKFEYRVFGKPNATGRSLYISMHGGGGAPAAVNEQQWRNQIKLYQPDEGVYLAPRAPTDTWNLWHQKHIDQLFERIIQDAVVFEGVDPNRVYLMGYSAGGDGVYQLAPRMADRWAAAAMMAGHPNDASPLGLRNIGFTIHVGQRDSGYKRNEVAAKWKDQLAALRGDDPNGYAHLVVIHEGKGHWMDLQDADAMAWMAKFVRDPIPQRVVWRQSSVIHPQFYWLAVDVENAVAGAELIARRKGQAIEIERAEGIGRFRVRLRDDMLDLDREVEIRMGDRTLYRGKPRRNVIQLAETLKERGDVELIFASEVQVEINQ